MKGASEALPDEQRIRERLFDVLREFPVLYQARQGVGSKIVNPFASLERVVRSHVNPLLLYINDLVQEIQQGFSYLEALDRVIKFALQHKYRDRVVSAVQQLHEIEGERPYFLWGLASLARGPEPAARAQHLQAIHRKLHLMNRDYSEKFGAEGNVDIVPWRVTFRAQTDGITDGTYEFPTRQQLETFRRALASLDRLHREQRTARWLHKGLYKNIREEMVELARLLFDYGYTAEEMGGPKREGEAPLCDFLNDMLLSELETSVPAKADLDVLSRHLILLSLLDYRAMIPFRGFYRRPSVTQEALAMAKALERQEKIKVSAYRRVVQLYQRYREARLQLPAFYLDFQFCRAHGDYFPVRDGGGFGVELTRKFVLSYYDNKDAQQKAVEEAKKYYSSKASQEMLQVLQLLINALSRPEQIRGRRVHILGHIQSGAMGMVLIAIHRGNIVALKEAKMPKATPMPLSEQVRHLEYEARLHAHVQSGSTQHENIVECFDVVEEEGRRFLALGYHPAETLGALLKRSRAYFVDPSSEEVPPLLVSDVKAVSTQLFRALYRLKERQVVHRDLKPGNVLYLVDTEGRVSLVKLIDFGVALGIGPGAPKDIHERQVVGTIGYMAPEMVFREASYPSDLYSAGAILYQLLSGKLPVEFGRARNMAELKIQLRRVVQEKRIPLAHANPALAQEASLNNLADLVDRMLARDPTKRPPLDSFFEDWTEAWKETPEDILMQPIRYAP